MTNDQHNTLAAELVAADARFLRASEAYAQRVARDGVPPDESAWPESIEVDAASDARWEIEETALASGDPESVGIVMRRRHRDDVPCAALAA